VRDGDHADLTATSGHAQLVGDRLLHVRDGTLVAQTIDGETTALTGRPAALATSTAISPSGHASFAASARLIVVAPAAPRVREMAWFDDGGVRLAPAGEPGDLWQVRLSPDDRHAAVTLIDPLLRTLDVTTVPLDRPGDRAKLTLALAADTDPVWSPDGTRVVFRSMEGGRPALFFRRAHEPAAAIEPGPDADAPTPTDWRGGRMLVTVGGGRNTDIVAMDEAGTPMAIADTGFAESDGRWSPDGRWIAFVSDESGQADVYARRIPMQPDSPRTRVSFAGGARPRWSADGRSLFFLRGAQVLRADLQGARFTSPRAIAEIPGVRDFDAAHRSGRLLVLLSTTPAPAMPAAIVDWPALVP
jgi:Tol biopolymer transport system component